MVIVPMPLNLAILAPEAAESVINSFPGVAHWAIGGHSLGGATAARFVHQHPSAVEGLVLWAAYLAESNSLADRQAAVVSIYGTLDGPPTLAKINASRSRLLADTCWVSIEGGNHAQFGWYGAQRGYNAATITAGEQQQQVVAATTQLLESLSIDRE